MPSRDSLRRRRPSRAPLPRFLVVCEGTVTEPKYFQELRHALRIPIVIDLLPGGTPKTLVQRAVEVMKQAKKDAKRDANAAFEEIWCVFDVDEHPFVEESKQQAKANQISVAVSNPCFELWVLLHFQDQRGHIQRQDVRQRCLTHLPGYEKHLPCESLLPLRTAATKRARDLDHWHDSRGTLGGNPSTGVYRLLDKLLSYLAQ